MSSQFNEKPYSAAADRNKSYILDVLKQYLQTEGRLLEIGAGTGQHALFLANKLPHIEWVATDRPEYHSGIMNWFNTQKIDNLIGPLSLTIGIDDFPSKKPFNYVFTANTLHIMSWKECKTLFKLLGKRLREGSLVFFYGPFNYNNQYTSDSNKEFDLALKLNNSSSGIRNFEDIDKTMLKFGFKQIADHDMPANNHILIYEKNH